MKNLILITIVLLMIPSAVLATHPTNPPSPMFGMGEASAPAPEPQPVVYADTFGMGEDVIQTAFPVDEVSWVYETVCDNGVCRLVPRRIRTAVNRAATKVAIRTAPIATRIPTVAPFPVSVIEPVAIPMAVAGCACGNPDHAWFATSVGWQKSTNSSHETGPEETAVGREVKERRENRKTAWRERPGVFGWRVKMSARMNGQSSMGRG